MAESVPFPAAFLTSDVDSLTRFITATFGAPPAGPPVLVSRAAQKDRPFFRILVPQGVGVRPATIGWDDAPRPYQIVYSTSSFADATYRADTLRSLMDDGYIPRYVRNSRWLLPSVTVRDPGGGPALPAGSYTMSCSYESINGHETLPCKSFGLTLATPAALDVLVPTWPWQSPLKGQAHVYIGQDDDMRTRAGSAPIPRIGGARIRVDSLPTSGVGERPEPSVVFVGQLRVEYVSVSLIEDDGVDGHFDAIISVFLGGEVYRPKVSTGRVYEEGEVVISGDASTLFTFDGFTV